MKSSVRLLFAARNVHTLRSHEGWCNAREWAVDDGDLRSAKRFRGADSAVRAGRRVASLEGLDHVVHDTMGRVVSRERFE